MWRAGNSTLWSIRRIINSCRIYFRYIDGHIGGLAKSFMNPVYHELKELTTGICLRLFLDVDITTAHELSTDLRLLTSEHWRGIISVPILVKLPGLTDTTYHKALLAKVTSYPSLSARPPVCPPDFLSARLPVCLSVHPTSCLSSHPPVYPPACPSACPPNFLSVRQTSRLSVHPTSCLSVCPPDFLSVRPAACLNKAGPNIDQGVAGPKDTEFKL